MSVCLCLRAPAMPMGEEEGLTSPPLKSAERLDCLSDMYLWVFAEHVGCDLTHMPVKSRGCGWLAALRAERAETRLLPTADWGKDA